MNKKVLFVDDDTKILSSFRRTLSDLYEVHVAEGGQNGLDILKKDGPFAVVISDLKMPGMDGIEFLRLASEKYSDTVRVMLTGYADLDSAVSAVNDGKIFRFLTKPCDTEVITQVLNSCIKQYRLIMAERELLQGTLKGSIKTLTDVLSLLKPDVYGRVSRIIPYVRKLSAKLKDPRPWQTETAARLALIGLLTLPDSIIKKYNQGRPLDGEELDVFYHHPGVAEALLSNIPRMDKLIEIIKYQNKNFDGSGVPRDLTRKEEIPLGARILKVALDFDIKSSLPDSSKKDALLIMRRTAGVYDPMILKALEEMLGDEAKYHVLTVEVAELKNHMILMEDINLSRGGKKVKVLSRGQEISEASRRYLRKYIDQGFIGKSVKVIEPITSEEQESNE